MKTVPTALQAMLESELATLATCWKLALQNGTDYFFTDHDVDLIIDGNTYEASSGMMPKALDQNAKLSPDNMDVVAFLESAKISELDILAGDLDYATVDIFVVDYNNLVAEANSVVEGDPIGFNSIGSSLGGFTANSARVLYQVTRTMNIDADLGLGYFYIKARDAFGTDASDVRMLIYEIGVDDANSPLVASSNTIALSDQSYAWIEFVFPATTLENGKTYAVAFAAGGITAQGEGIDGAHDTPGGGVDTDRAQTGISVSSPPPDLSSYDAMGQNAQTSIYAKWSYIDETEKLWLAQGWTLGRIEIQDQAFTAEIRGKAQHLDQQLIERTTPECRANLGDVRCTVDMDDSAGTFRYDAGVVTSQSGDRRTFIDTGAPNSEDFFSGGLLTWLTPESGDSFNGGNAGYQMEVKSYDTVTQEFILFQPMPVDIEAGDEFTVKFGCNKGTTHCKDRFSNLVNFRGEPFIPGWDATLHTGKA